MGNLIMPKHSGVVFEFKTALKVCYDRQTTNDGWVPTGNAMQGVDGFTYYLFREYQSNNVEGHSTPKKDNSDYTKDAQLPLYFGFLQIAESKSNALRRITPTGIKLYEALVDNNKNAIYSLFVNALESTTFGRNNSACENSNSDIEAPNVLILSSISLNGIKRKEFYYILSLLDKNGGELSNALSAVQMLREHGEDIPNVDNTYTDAKFIPFWLSIGFLSEKIENKLHVSDEVKQKYYERLIRLRSKNTEKPMKLFQIEHNITSSNSQKIYYGCPGTGKSHKVKELTEGKDSEKIVYFDQSGNLIEDISTVADRTKISTNIFRTTFHPDYDYSSFVGSYKPVMIQIPDKNGDDTNTEELIYDFVPQVFTNAYVRAWKSLADESLTDAEKQVYLIIEEINRGNCAQIFGDLFQLLDRKNGYSEYPIIPDAELRKYLAKQGLESNRLKLPCNLHILATMNTSDQSLFPMDSAFKRRWAMEYVPINLKHEDAAKLTFTINGAEYSWVEFLAKVNPLIRKATDSEDKQMGEFFIKENISEEDFKNKVMFYIWNDICKDLYSASRLAPQFFMRDNEGDGRENAFTFAELYGAGRFNEEDNSYTEPSALLEGFITKYLKLKKIEAIPTQGPEQTQAPEE